MLQVILSDRKFENDVYPLVKAFYPRETVKICTREEDRPENTGQLEETGQPAEERQQIPGQIRIGFREDGITVEIKKRHGELISESAALPPFTLHKSGYKNGMKRTLYRLFSDLTGKQFPWGILTGIRPTKLVYDMLTQGLEEDFIYERMSKEYLCSRDKTRMSITIAGRERELLTAMDYRNGYSLYIGIPFCPSTCLYCSFPSYPMERFASYGEAYLEALEKEILFASGCFPDKKLTSVYFGGGTPTTLSAFQLNKLLGFVRERFDFTHVKEFCVEAGRPDSITGEKLEVLKKRGVDRISINPQSMQQRTLDLIGRKHSVEQIKEAFLLARETGHENINMDLIIGLPGENPADVEDTLKQIKELSPDGLTVHTLALKRAARLNIEKESYAALQAEDVCSMLEKTVRFAEDNHYLPYYLYRQKNMADNLENVGYSRYGKEGLYNILIMEEQQTILALGAGAMSKFVFHEESRIERVDNVKSITDYISRTDEMIGKKQKFLRENGPLL